MTTIQIVLPDQLAQEAQREGLLSSESVEQLFRTQLRVKALKRLNDNVRAMGPSNPFSSEEITAELAAARAARRAASE